MTMSDLAIKIQFQRKYLLQVQYDIEALRIIDSNRPEIYLRDIPRVAVLKCAILASLFVAQFQHAN